MCFILVHVGLRSVLVLLEKVYMGKDGVQLNSYTKTTHIMVANNTQPHLSSDCKISEETILKISKEIAIKFIEVGRLTPSTFDKTFKDIHRTLQQTVKK